MAKGRVTLSQGCELEKAISKFFSQPHGLSISQPPCPCLIILQEARRSGHNHVGTEQMLLGIVGEGTGLAARIRKSMHLGDANLGPAAPARVSGDLQKTQKEEGETLRLGFSICVGSKTGSAN